MTAKQLEGTFVRTALGEKKAPDVERRLDLLVALLVLSAMELLLLAMHAQGYLGSVGSYLYIVAGLGVVGYFLVGRTSWVRNLFKGPRNG